MPVGVVLSLLWTNLNGTSVTETPELIAVCLVTLGYGLIGWIDDWQVLRRKSNKGISPEMKLALQIVFGILFTVWLFWHKSAAITNVSLPGFSLSLGWLFFTVSRVCLRCGKQRY